MKKIKITESQYQILKKKIGSLNEGLKDSWNSFITAAKREGKETRDAVKILKKLLTQEEVTDGEIKFLKSQSGDLAKIVAVMSLGAVSMAIPLALEKILNKWNISILPKSQSHLKEGNWRDTDWSDDEGRITIGQIIDYIGNNVEDIPVSYLEKELKSQLSTVTKEPERIMKAELQYPIILVKRNGRIEYVLDGNHRLQKAIMTGEEYIKSKILDLDNEDTPEEFKRLLESNIKGALDRENKKRTIKEVIKKYLNGD